MRGSVLDQTLIQGQILTSDVADMKASSRAAPVRRQLSAARLIGEEMRQSIRESLGVAWRHELGSAAIAGGDAVTRYVGRDHRNAGGHRLDQDESQRFASESGERGAATRRQQPRQARVFDRPEEIGALGYAQLLSTTNRRVADRTNDSQAHSLRHSAECIEES